MHCRAPEHDWRDGMPGAVIFDVQRALPPETKCDPDVCAALHPGDRRRLARPAKALSFQQQMTAGV